MCAAAGSVGEERFHGSGPGAPSDGVHRTLEHPDAGAASGPPDGETLRCMASIGLASRPWALFLITFTLAFALRAPYVLTRSEQAALQADGYHYDQVARSLAAGRGLARLDGRIYRGEPGGLMYTPPLYPLILAAFYRLGLTYRGVLAFQAALDSAGIALLADLARRLFGERAAILTGLLGSVSMLLVFHTGMLLTETVTTFLIVAWLWLVGLDARARWPAPASAAALALIVGLAMMCRPTTQVLAFALVIVWGVRALMGQRPAAVRLGVFVVTLFLVLLPWMARNYRVMGQFLPTTTAGLYNGLIGWNPRLLEVYEAHTREQHQAARRELHVFMYELNAGDPAVPYWDRMMALRHDAVRYVREHPAAAFRLWLYKLRHYITPGVSRFDYPWAFVLASWLWETSLFGLALVGLWRRWNVAPAFRTVALLAVAGSWIIHSLIYVQVRYRIPFVEPVALLYAGAAVADGEPPKQEPDGRTPRQRT